MIATIINCLLIILGSACGLLLKGKLPQRFLTVLSQARGLCVVSIGMTSAIGTKNTLCVVVCLVIGTITEVSDIANVQEALDTRGEHEAITNAIAQLMQQQGVAPYILSTEACAICERCAYLDGQPCRFPEKMHPCVESHGINVIPAMESQGIPFISGENVVTWVSLLFFNE